MIGYDADDNIAALGSALYSYDAIYRLIGANDATYTSTGATMPIAITSQGSGWLETAYTIDTSSNKLLRRDWFTASL